MTEQMAIQQLKIQRTFTNGSNAKVDAIDMAIKALEEIQQYRALGTVEELKELKEKQKYCLGYRSKDDIRCSQFD